MRLLQLIISLSGCVLSGVSMVYIGGLEVSLAHTYDFTPSIIADLNAAYFAGQLIGILTLSAILDSSHIDRVVTVSSACATASIIMLHFPINLVLMHFGEFVLGLTITPCYTYATKIIYKNFLKYRSQLIPITVVLMVLGNASSGLIENLSFSHGYVSTNSIVLALFFTQTILYLFVLLNSKSDFQSTTRSLLPTLSDIKNVLTPITNQRLFLPMLCSGFTIGVIMEVFFNTFIPVIFHNSNFTGMTSVTFLVKGFSTLVLGISLTKYFGTLRGLVMQYILYCVAVSILTLCIYMNTNLHMIAYTIIFTALIIGPNCASTTYNILEATPQNHVAAVTGCYGLVYVMCSFLASLLANYLLPAKRIHEFNLSDVAPFTTAMNALGMIAIIMIVYLIWDCKRNKRLHHKTS